MKRKGIAVGVIVLFLGFALTQGVLALDIKRSSTVRPIQNSDGTTLYVGGSGPGNYSRIQDAVDNASNGDTVFVYHGVYNQIPYSDACVVIAKSINLIGEDKNTTIINGSRIYDVIDVRANSVQICGFTIQNCGAGYHPGSGIDIYTDDIHVFDNIFIKNYNGLSISACQNGAFFDNIFINNGRCYGIMSSSNCSFYHNLFINNSIGISVYQEGTVVIEYNEFRGNEKGIDMGNCKGITIHFNNFYDNTIQATYLKEGSLFQFLQLVKYKQDWNGNYWNDWNKTTPKPIKGSIILDVSLPFFPLPIAFGPFPSYEFDRTPAQDPFIIPISV